MPVPREGSKAFKFGENATKSQDPSVYRGTRAVSLVTDTLQLGKPRQAIQGTLSLSAESGTADPLARPRFRATRPLRPPGGRRIEEVRLAPAARA